MKSLLLLLPFLLTSPALAEVNPAQTKLEPYTDVFGKEPFIRYEGFFCGHSLKFKELSRPPKKESRCTVQLTDEAMVINGAHRINRSDVVHFWRTKVTGGGGGYYRYFFFRHREADEVKTSVVLVQHETWQGIFWNQVNLWMSEGFGSAPEAITR